MISDYKSDRKYIKENSLLIYISKNKNFLLLLPWKTVFSTKTVRMFERDLVVKLLVASISESLYLWILSLKDKILVLKCLMALMIRVKREIN